MAVSEAIYCSTTTSYVSSSGYYGFVPQNNIIQPVNCCSSNVVRESRNGNCQQHQYQQQHGAMETDDDNGDACFVNNYSVIPETLRGINPAVYFTDGGNRNSTAGLLSLAALNNRQESRHDAATAARYRNRKRNNDGELIFVESDQFKKLRKGSGNCCTNDAGCWFSKDYRLAEVRCKSARFCVSGDEGKYIGEENLATIDSCCWAAGNDNYIVNHNNKNKDLLNDNLKLCQSKNSEYERMLLETHGCSAYHYQRLQFENGIIEAEF